MWSGLGQVVSGSTFATKTKTFRCIGYNESLRRPNIYIKSLRQRRPTWLHVLSSVKVRVCTIARILTSVWLWLRRCNVARTWNQNLTSFKKGIIILLLYLFIKSFLCQKVKKEVVIQTKRKIESSLGAPGHGYTLPLLWSVLALLFFRLPATPDSSDYQSHIFLSHGKALFTRANALLMGHTPFDVSSLWNVCTCASPINISAKGPPPWTRISSYKQLQWTFGQKRVSHNEHQNFYYSGVLRKYTASSLFLLQEGIRQPRLPRLRASKFPGAWSNNNNPASWILSLYLRWRSTHPFDVIRSIELLIRRANEANLKRVRSFWHPEETYCAPSSPRPIGSKSTLTPKNRYVKPMEVFAVGSKHPSPTHLEIPQRSTWLGSIHLLSWDPVSSCRWPKKTYWVRTQKTDRVYEPR